MKMFYPLLLLPFIADAQIKSIGPFHINRTNFRIVDSIAKSANLKILTGKDSYVGGFDKREEKRLTTIINLVPEQGKKGSITDRTFRTPGIRSIFINHLKIDGLSFQEIHLLFLRDTLVSFESNGSKELLDALTKKYGKPHYSEYERSEECDLEKSRIYVDVKSLYYEWGTATKYTRNAIVCQIRYSPVFGEDCQPEYYYHFELENKDITDKITNVELFGR